MDRIHLPNGLWHIMNARLSGTDDQRWDSKHWVCISIWLRKAEAARAGDIGRRVVAVLQRSLIQTTYVAVWLLALSAEFACTFGHLTNRLRSRRNFSAVSARLADASRLLIFSK